MHCKNILAGLLFVVTACTSVAAPASTGDTLQIDFFRCAFLSRAEIAFNAACNGDLTEDMVNDLTPEDRANLIVSITTQIALKQSELLTDTQQNLITVGEYAAGTVAAASFLAYAYGIVTTSMNVNSWLLHHNEAWACEDDKAAGWQDEQAKHLRRSAKFRWESGKSALILLGAAATQAAAGVAWTLLHNAAEDHDDAVEEIANLQSSLELINSLQPDSSEELVVA